MKPNNYWWNDGVNKHELVFDTVEQITENQTHRPKDNFNHARLYGNAHFLTCAVLCRRQRTLRTG